MSIYEIDIEIDSDDMYMREIEELYAAAVAESNEKEAQRRAKYAARQRDYRARAGPARGRSHSSTTNKRPRAEGVSSNDIDSDDIHMRELEKL